MLSRTGGSVGIGFAIPINSARSVVAQLAESGHVTRGWLGVKVQRLTPELAKSFGVPATGGALVTDVQPSSPAQKAGVKSGDVLLEYDGKAIAGLEELPRVVAQTPVGRTVALGVIRDGKPLKLSATIARLDEPTVAGTTAEPADAHAALGIAVQPLTPDVAREAGVSRGVVVRDVREGGKAAAAGLQPGDVIVEVDRRPVASVKDLRTALDGHAKGAPILMLVHRDGESLYVAVTS
jgi:serine protease Do